MRNATKALNALAFLNKLNRGRRDRFSLRQRPAQGFPPLRKIRPQMVELMLAAAVKCYTCATFLSLAERTHGVPFAAARRAAIFASSWSVRMAAQTAGMMAKGTTGQLVARGVIGGAAQTPPINKPITLDDKHLARRAARPSCAS